MLVTYFLVFSWKMHYLTPELANDPKVALSLCIKSYIHQKKIQVSLLGYFCFLGSLLFSKGAWGIFNDLNVSSHTKYIGVCKENLPALLILILYRIYC